MTIQLVCTPRAFPEHLRERHAGSGRQREQRSDEEEIVHGDPPL
jgi:hypothetical protein